MKNHNAFILTLNFILINGFLTKMLSLVNNTQLRGIYCG